MSPNTKDSNSSKNRSVQKPVSAADKRKAKGSADNKPESPTGSHNKGEKKTTP
jgi:hypothetical protein